MTRGAHLGLAAGLGLALAGPVHAEGLIDVRLAPERNAATIKAIADVGRPEWHAMEGERSFDNILLRKCGAIQPAYVVAFAEANGLADGADVATLEAGRIYRFPACARAPAPRVVEVAKGQTLETILERAGVQADLSTLDLAPRLSAAPDPTTPEVYRTSLRFGDLGVTISPTFRAKANALALAKLNPDLNPRNMQIRDTVAVPFQRPIWTSIPLQDDVTVEQAKSAIKAAISADGGTSQVSDVTTAALISGIGAYQAGYCPVALPEDAPQHAIKDSDWPISVADLSTALEENVAGQRDAPHRETVTILVLDTGYDGEILGNPIPEDRITRLRAPQPPSLDTSLGVNLATYGLSAYPPVDLADRLHGSEVAWVALTAGAKADTAAIKGLPIKVAFASVADEGVLNARGISDALAFAVRNQIKVVNISLMAGSDAKAFEAGLKERGVDAVIVAAAGNDHREYGVDAKTWPGGYGGDAGNAKPGSVITVGGHDRLAAIGPYSRYGEFVDLLAPGCAIPTVTAGPEGTRAAVPVHREGTSYAAPLVSNAAAQLIAAGVEPPFVKNRLLASVDVDGALDERVYSRGRLNVRKALTLRRDVVEFYDIDGKAVIRTGEVNRRGAILTPCAGDIPVSRLLKLSFTGPPGERSAHIWLKSDTATDPTRITRRALCKGVRLETQKLMLSEPGAVEPREIPLDRLIDFVPRAVDPRAPS